MTDRILRGLAEVRGGPGVWIAVLLALVVIVPVALIVDGVVGISRRARERRTYAITSVRCPRRHPLPTRGSYKCPSCNLAHTGHAFAPCPHCAMFAAAILCPCGLPVRNPLWVPEEGS